MEKLLLGLFPFISKRVYSYQNDDPHESNLDEKFVKVSEDVPLEGGDGGQEAPRGFGWKPRFFTLQCVTMESNLVAEEVLRIIT